VQGTELLTSAESRDFYVRHCMASGFVECPRCELLWSMIPTFVSLFVTWLRCANTAKQIDVLLRVETIGDPRNTVFDGSDDFSTDSMRPSLNYFNRLFLIWKCLEYGNPYCKFGPSSTGTRTRKSKIKVRGSSIYVDTLLRKSRI